MSQMPHFSKGQVFEVEPVFVGFLLSKPDLRALNTVSEFAKKEALQAGSLPNNNEVLGSVEIPGRPRGRPRNRFK